MKKKICFCIIVMMICCCFPMLASSICQQRNTQVISPDPSLEVKVMKAYRSGEYIIVDMLFCNISSKDYNVNIALQRKRGFCI